MVLNSNFPLILPHFRHIEAFSESHFFIPYPYSDQLYSRSNSALCLASRFSPDSPKPDSPKRQP